MKYFWMLCLLSLLSYCLYKSFETEILYLTQDCVRIWLPVFFPNTDALFDMCGKIK